MSWIESQLKAYNVAKLEGDRLLEQGESEEARLRLEEALGILDTVYRREHEATFALLQKACDTIVEKNLSLGDQYRDSEDYSLAREHYQIALDLSMSKDQKEEIRIRLSQTYPERATTNLSKLFSAVQEAPDNPVSLYNFATELALEGYYPEAAAYFQKVVEITPEDADSHLRLANALADCDRYEEAEKAYGNARQQGADEAEVLYRLGELYIHRGQHLEALKFLKECLTVEPGHIESYRAIGHIHDVDGEYDQAIAAMNEVLRLDPDDSQTHFEIGSLHEMKGDLDQARICWEKAIEVDPEGEFADYARDKLDENFSSSEA